MSDRAEVTRDSSCDAHTDCIESIGRWNTGS